MLGFKQKNELLVKIVYNIEMLNTNREFYVIYVIFQNRAGDKIKPQMRECPAQIGRVGMSVDTDQNQVMHIDPLH